VSPDNEEIFAQHHPGLTVLLLGDDGAQRLVVTANYDVSSEANRTVPSNVVALNTPIEIGDVRVKVLKWPPGGDAPGIPVAAPLPG